jgi:integrase
MKFVPLSGDQAKGFVTGLASHIRAAGVLAAGTGMRQGELFGLTIDRVDFLHRRLRVDRQLITPDRGECHLGPLKTATSYRTVTLNQVVLDALSAHIRTYGTGEWGLLFHSGERRVSRHMATNYAIQASAGTARADARWHALRHHHASTLLSAGLNPAVVAERIGDTLQVLMATYAHVMPNDDERVREVLDGALGLSAEDWLRTEGSEADAAEG